MKIIRHTRASKKKHSHTHAHTHYRQLLFSGIHTHARIMKLELKNERKTKKKNSDAKHNVKKTGLIHPVSKF